MPLPFSRRLITRRIVLSIAPLPIGTPRRRRQSYRSRPESECLVKYTVVGLVILTVRITGGIHSTRGFVGSMIHYFLGDGRTVSVALGFHSLDRNALLTPNLTPQRPSPLRSGTAPSSASPTRPDTPPGDPEPPPPPPASPQTSCASGSTPFSSRTSTAARSGSGSASRPAGTLTGTADDGPTTAGPPACCSSGRCPGTG